MQVIFLHGDSASKDGTEGDGACHENQLGKKMERGLLCGKQKQEEVVSLTSDEGEERTGVDKAISLSASVGHTFSFDVRTDALGG